MSGYKNDTAFEAVLQNTGQNIEAFIDDFFSFLARRYGIDEVAIN